MRSARLTFAEVNGIKWPPKNITIPIIRIKIAMHRKNYIKRLFLKKYQIQEVFRR